mmetsp:Transcript_9863/g.29874  ORF Transcript_9863/g.29874 Transcript_9863/m.29874 type:complete len:278 (-) Transcript_9863:20-853(-)
MPKNLAAFSPSEFANTSTSGFLNRSGSASACGSSSRARKYASRSPASICRPFSRAGSFFRFLRSRDRSSTFCSVGNPIAVPLALASLFTRPSDGLGSSRAKSSSFFFFGSVIVTRIVRGSGVLVFFFGCSCSGGGGGGTASNVSSFGVVAVASTGVGGAGAASAVASSSSSGAAALSSSSSFSSTTLVVSSAATTSWTGISSTSCVISFFSTFFLRRRRFGAPDARRGRNRCTADNAGTALHPAQPATHTSAHTHAIRRDIAAFTARPRRSSRWPRS